MVDSQLQVLGVVGSLNQNSVTRVVIQHAAEALTEVGCHVDIFDPVKEHLPLFNPDSSYSATGYSTLQKRVAAADVFLLGTPDYHGSISSTLKNFLDHFWQEFTGKLFATVVSSHEKGLTVTDQLRTVARQCYAWSLPYGVSFVDREDVKEGAVSSEVLLRRLEMLAHDIKHYGCLLAEQRLKDLNGNEPGFMARHRPKK
ncbi:MAG TPA: NAD(P)H-dependent oxidoreductase [Verrucomicrobiae bacterium]|nr:NAD(P)H-dependent oxidoreductase [Verrucomicrobiae bacterium]